MKTIAIVLPDLRGGGAERVSLTLASEFVRAGMSVDLVLGQARGELIGEIPDGVQIIDLAAERLRGMIPAFARYLHRAQPAAVLAVMQEVNCVAVLGRALVRRGKSVRLVLSEHSAPSAQTKSLPNRRGRWLIRAFVRMLYPRAEGIVAVSQGVADDLHENFVPRSVRVSVIQNPVDTRLLRERSGERVDHAWLGYRNMPILVAVGNLGPAKDFATLLRAFALLRHQRPARLMILGEGRERSSLESLAAELGITGDVAMPSFVPNPWAWMAKTDLFVSSSRWEGFSMVIAEALALGVPVVATDCPSGPSEILDGGRYGKLVPVGDVQALASAMSEALDAPREPETLKHRAEAFGSNKIAAQYLDVLMPGWRRAST